MKTLEQDFYKEIVRAINIFVDGLIEKLKNKNSDMIDTHFKKEYRELQSLKLKESQLNALRKIVKEACTGVVHSLFVSIDGGTAISDHGKALDLIDYKTRKTLTTGALHENFIGEIVNEEISQKH